MNKTFSILLFGILLCAVWTTSARAETVTGPDGRLCVELTISNSQPTYSVTYDGKAILLSSPLGLVTNDADFSRSLQTVSAVSGKREEHYTLNRSKCSEVNYIANTLLWTLKNEKGQTFSIMFAVSNNDVAFRYEIPYQNDRASVRIDDELTGFRFPDGTTTFLTPQSHAMIGWKRSKPSYEEEYAYDAPMASRSFYGHGYTFPCLFRIGESGWALVSETGTDRNYCGCRLSDTQDGNLYSVEFPMMEENNGNGTISPAFSLPGSTPWRTITVGNTLKPIVETTAPWNTVSELYDVHPSISSSSFGKSTWSWIVWQDASMNWDDQVAYIDLAHTLGYKYILIDAGWDKQLGYEKMEKLIRYAQSQKVDVFLWYSSSGYWNDIVQTPVNIMDDPIARRRDMKWMQRLGVKGIKVDFWGGDKQETMRLYEDVFVDANEYGLMVICHGCTLPRGWERMFPNYVGSEAVLASENLVFSQHACDIEALATATHPFIRNAVGCMEWGGSFLNRRIGRGNQRGNHRRTTDCHELAQAVLFQNPIQNFAITPENLKPESEGGAPKVSLDFMKEVPTTWDKTCFIDGYPGRFVVLARGHEGKWYVAGNNAEKETKTLTLDLSGMFKKGDRAVLYSDRDDREPQRMEIKISNPKKVKVRMLSAGGFVIVSL
ncbi:MAG: glycoside hydrolase family 97 catalytic domain-containing protein [Prevotella sp.]|nr:glycoside hydrolase family 97 catalytic domain-containing protein [Candidatus Equicola faecalis]